MIYTTFLGGHKARVFEGTTKLYRQKVYFSTQFLDAGDSDVHQVIPVKAGDVVLAAWIDIKEAAPSNATVDLGYGTVVNYWGNGLPLDAVGIASTILSQSATLYPYAIASGLQEAIDVDVDGASYNDQVMVSPDGADIADMVLTGHVISPNTVAVRIINVTGGILDAPSIATNIVVNKAPLASQPVVFTGADTIDIKATTDTKDVNISSGSIEICALILRT